MPTPNQNESHDDFIDRCMGDDEAVADYPDDDQRRAFCETQWDDSRSAPAVERRTLMDDKSVRIEKRDDGESVIAGHAAVFYDGTPETEFELWKDLVERVMVGAFDDALSRPDNVRALFNHDPNMVLGRTPNTLTLSTDKRGLRFEILPGSTTIATDVVEHVSRGDVTGSSFAFRVTEEKWRVEEDDLEIREILNVELFDVGPVTYPAYEGTDVGLRAEGGVEEARAAYARWKKSRHHRSLADYRRLLRLKG